MTDTAHYRPGAAWGMAALLAAFTLINFIDKAALGMVAVPLMAELHLSPAEFGMIAGSFYWLFGISAVVVGFLANRVPTRWLLLIMAAAWAVLQLPIAITGGALTVLLCRAALGAAEGPGTAVALHALYKWFPDSKRTLPGALVIQGGILGMLLAGLVIPQITQRWGWRMNFVILAAVGAVWVLAWLVWGREGNLGHQGMQGAAANARLPYARLLTDPSMLTLFLLCFSAYWTISLNLTWLPSYMEKALGFSSVTAGRWVALIVVAGTPVGLVAGFLSERLLKRGRGSRVARVMLINGSVVLAAILLLCVGQLDLAPVQKALLQAAATGLLAVTFVLSPPILGEIVPPLQRGGLMAIYTAIGNVAGALGPMVMGQLVQHYGSTNAHGYETGFMMGAVLLVVSALASLRWLHPDRSRQTLGNSVAPATA